jgi:hypothetical protein
MTIEVSAVIHFFSLLDAPDKDIPARLQSFYGYCQSENSAVLELEISQRENRP